MMKTIDFSGVSTAIATPMHNGKVDFAGLERLLEWQIAGGVTGVVPVGTTGESPTLSADEHLEVIRRTVEIVNGRALVIAGTGSNSTEEAVEYTRKADEAGVDAMLQVTPYYNKPTQEGLFHHFSAVANVTEKPVMLYSIPGRCVIEIGIEICERLYESHPQISAIKEAGGSCDRVAALRRALGPDYFILSGDDNMTLPFQAVGGDGVVSVASNLFPAELSVMCKAARSGDFRKALEVHQRFSSFFRDIFLEPNPVPIKFLLKLAGVIDSDEVRLPLSPLQPESKEQLKATWETLQSEVESA